jgi:hypothetical protein
VAAIVVESAWLALLTPISEAKEANISYYVLKYQE